MTAEEILVELVERLLKANDELITMANKRRRQATDTCDTGTWVEADRLIAKAAGVRLALAYIREMPGMPAPDLNPHDLTMGIYTNGTSTVVVRITHRPTGMVVSAEGEGRFRTTQKAENLLRERLGMEAK